VYLSDPITWKFIPAGLSLFRLKYELPGVFENTPHYGVDGSLWTLYYEVFCYISLSLVGFSGLLVPRIFTLVITAYLVVYTYLRIHLGASASMGGYTELTLPFSLGVAIYIYRNRIILNITVQILLFAGVVVLHKSSIYRESIVFTIVYGTFFIGFSCSRLTLLYNNLGDYSYGMYIFAFPVQQALATSLPGITPWQMIAIAWPATLVLAVLSWHLVENPILVKRHALGEFLNRRLRQTFALSQPTEMAAGSVPSDYPLEPNSNQVLRAESVADAAR